MSPKHSIYLWLGAIRGLKPYEFVGFRWACIPQTALVPVLGPDSRAPQDWSQQLPDLAWEPAGLIREACRLRKHVKSQILARAAPNLGYP